MVYYMYAQGSVIAPLAIVSGYKFRSPFDWVVTKPFLNITKTPLELELVSLAGFECATTGRKSGQHRFPIFQPALYT